MGSTDGRTVEDRAKAWEVRLKILGFVSALSAGVFGFVKYIDQREKELEQGRVREVQQAREAETKHADEVAAADKAYRLQLYQERRKLYADACAAAATIAVAEGPEKAPEAVRDFWRLYYGELCLVEDDAVARAMVGFAEQMTNPAEDTDLRSQALALSSACRASLNLKELYGTPELKEQKAVVRKRGK